MILFGGSRLIAYARVGHNVCARVHPYTKLPDLMPIDKKTKKKNQPSLAHPSFFFYLLNMSARTFD